MGGTGQLGQRYTARRCTAAPGSGPLLKVIRQYKLVHELSDESRAAQDRQQQHVPALIAPPVPGGNVGA